MQEKKLNKRFAPRVSMQVADFRAESIEVVASMLWLECSRADVGLPIVSPSKFLEDARIAAMYEKGVSLFLSNDVISAG